MKGQILYGFHLHEALVLSDSRRQKVRCAGEGEEVTVGWVLRFGFARRKMLWRRMVNRCNSTEPQFKRVKMGKVMFYIIYNKIFLF